MKKFFTLFAAALVSLSMLAVDAVFDASDFNGKGTSQTGSEVTATKNGVTFTCDKAYGDSYGVRCYKNGVVSISCEQQIAKIIFEFATVSGTYYNGGLDEEIIVDSTKWEATMSSQARMNKIRVYLGNSAELTNDTLSVLEAVTLAKGLEANATSDDIYYVEGYAAFVADYSVDYKNQDFYLVDDLASADSAFMVYRATPEKDGKAYPVLAGDKVRVFGALKNYESKEGAAQLEIVTPTVEFLEEVEGDRTIAGNTPELPEGVISCAAAVDSAKAIADPVEEKATVKGGEVKVRGYVTYAYNESNGKQSAWLNDEKGAKAGQIQGAYLKVAEAVAVGDYVEVAGTLAKYKQAAKDGKPAEIVLEVIDGTMVKIGADGKPIEPAQPDTLSVAEAMRVGYALLDNAISPKKYVIKGYVSSIEAYYDAQYQNETFWIADSVGSRAATNAGGAFYVYRGKIDTEKEIGLNALVYVTANITKYSKECKEPVIETAGGKGYSVSVTVAEQGLEETIDTINVAKAMEIGQAMEQGAATDNRYVITGYVSSIDVPFSEQYKNETFWITDTKGEKTSDKTKAFYVYRGKPNVEKEIGLGAKVSIVCKIKNFKGTIENDGMGIQFEVLEEGVAPKIDSITVTEAIELGMSLADGAYSDDIYVVKGFATKAYAPDSCKTSQNVYMADLPDAYGTFYAYNCSPDELVKDGDYIFVLGKIQKYVSAKGTTIEIGGGSAVHATAPKIDTINVSVSEAVVIAKELNPETGKSLNAEGLYAVTGYVVGMSRTGDTYYLSDDANAEESEFSAYKCDVVDSVEVQEGDLVVVIGAIQNYRGVDSDEQEYNRYQVSYGKLMVISGQGIENVVLTEKAQKVVVDGVLYIIRDEKMYNVQGTQVR